MIPNPLDSPVISVEEAGVVLKMGRSAAYDAVRRGEIPAIRFGRRVVVPTAKLLAMLGLDGPAAAFDGGAPKDAGTDSVDNPLLREAGRAHGT